MYAIYSFNGVEKYYNILYFFVFHLKSDKKGRLVRLCFIFFVYSYVKYICTYNIYTIYIAIYELHKINIRLFVSPVELDKNLTAKKKALLTLLFILF